MAIIALDLGGTKLLAALIDETGEILHRDFSPLQNRKGDQVAQLLDDQIDGLCSFSSEPIRALGICVPGIYRDRSGTVWVPNIPGWSDYPLRAHLTAHVRDRKIAVKIDSDRACYILGEVWRGAARGCTDAVFLAVGTGIGAGILADGRILRGTGDIAGAVGWFALDRPFHEEYKSCGCFEYAASGEGLARYTRDLLSNSNLPSRLRQMEPASIDAPMIFAAASEKDPLAERVLENAIELWGMSVANLVSLFNPQKIIFGGGVFGPAIAFLEEIHRSAQRWAQPIAMQQVKLAASSLGGDAGLLGAAALALKEST
ncbi:ROK family protein [candidate division KSB1 bacterium]|nr:ROK family protein [candidate division KSB1 bacterium]